MTDQAQEPNTGPWYRVDKDNRTHNQKIKIIELFNHLLTVL